jgi:plasmid stabilization system protein ParE
MRARETDTALQEIEQILAYIAAHSVSAASAVAAVMERTIGDIEDAPAAAPFLVDYNINAKLFRGYQYRVFYIFSEEELIIRNVRSTRRLLPGNDAQ